MQNSGEERSEFILGEAWSRNSKKIRAAGGEKGGEQDTDDLDHFRILLRTNEELYSAGLLKLSI
jgi:hypothetical protein